MEKIYTIGELKEAIKFYDDNDIVVLETTDQKTGDVIDLFSFHIDEIDGIELQDGGVVKEIRLCQSFTNHYYNEIH